MMYVFTTLMSCAYSMNRKHVNHFHFFTLSPVVTVSSFFNHSKVQFLGCWLASIDKPILDDVFQRFSDTPSEVRDSDLKILKTFIFKSLRQAFNY